MAILQTHNLSKHFGGVHALDRLSIQLKPGQITGIIGPNGSGKSTLVNVLTGIYPSDSGAVILGGEQLKTIRSPEVRDYGLTRTFQEVRLFEQIPALDNILVALTERGVFRALFERHKILHQTRAREILERVGLWEKRRALARELSYGQRKLLEIGRALAMDPKIILFDEPYAGLFPEMMKQVNGILRELRTQGLAIALIEHNMDLIRELADHVIVLDGGELLAEGPPAEVLARREVIEAYLGE
ncbi:MAG: ABC transporter ATP-binding protein [Candidatus Liptonbacteria bacterium]|nr:ABC transporter ATP-binding protein [Candidatus Liptonbacteria bacterium]